jgi:imidazole glycerol-phosphate synthase subunit HisF
MTKRNLRLIPRLDIKGKNLVKGIHLEGLRVLGTPEVFARRYAAEGADELLFMDAVASLYGRNSLLDVVEATARNVFIPLTVGGGIRSLDDIAAALTAGADKVAINTAAIENPGFIVKAAERYGSSTIVIHIDAKANKSGGWNAWVENGREPTRYNVVEWAALAASKGCGEILVTSIDREGTTKGFDTGLNKAVADAVTVPVIACGGAGEEQHLVDVANTADISAISLASILHYKLAPELEQEGFAFGGAGDFKVIAEKRSFGRVDPTDIASLKQHLASAGFTCREFAA